MEAKFYKKQKVICIASERYSKIGDRLRVVALGYSHFLGSDGMLHENSCFEDYRKNKRKIAIWTNSVPIWWTIA